MAFTPRKTALIIVLVSLAVFIESSIPYIRAEKNTPAGYHFLGQLAYVPDQNMYFSFISQAKDGAFLLKNKLTSIPNEPAFINLEYWLVGFVQRLSGISENAVYHVWRLMGAALLVVGFYMLAMVALPSPRRRLAALAAFLGTGGFGFLFALLARWGLVGFDVTQAGIIDMRYGMLPFQQMITNPHFLLPHGLILIAYAFYLIAERFGHTRHYIFSGIVFCVIGLVRPYDIIPPFIIFPLYILLISRRDRFDIRAISRRLLPLLMIVPVLLYNVWLFKFHHIFRYWSLQGHNADSLPNPFWHYLAYGIVGILALVRLGQAKKYPPGKVGLFTALWFVVTFVFIHLGKYIPEIGWSPQIGVYLLAPLALAAGSVQYRDLIPARAMRLAILSVVVFFILAGNIAVMMYYARDFNTYKKLSIFYAPIAEMEALQWLRGHAGKDDIVLADIVASQRIAKYTRSGVVAAHYSVTPKFAEYSQMAGMLLSDTTFVSGHRPLPEGMGITFVYVRGNRQPAQGQFLIEVFRNQGGAIYRVTK